MSDFPTEHQAERTTKFTRATDGHRPVQALHRGDEDEQGRHHDRARRRARARRRSTTSCSSPATATTTASTSTASSPASCCQGGCPAGHAATAAPATSSPTSSRSPAATRSVRWPWPTPGPTPTAASSSSSAADDGVRLPPPYSLFGQVTSGLDVVEAIDALGSPGVRHAQGDRDHRVGARSRKLTERDLPRRRWTRRHDRRRLVAPLAVG